MADGTYKESIYDNLTLPLSLLEEHFRLICDENGSFVSMGEILLDNAYENYQQIVDALEAKFGRLEIEHEDYNRQIYPWGKVIGVSSKK